MTYSYSVAKIIPRQADDIEMATLVVSADNTTISIYPNPVKNVLTVEGEDITSVKIIDINGKTVKVLNSTSAKKIINVEDLIQGIYFVKLNTTEGIKVSKLIKL